MEIDIEKLREDLIQYYLGAFFIGGFGAASLDASSLYNASNEEVIKIAIENNFDLDKYSVNNSKKYY